MEKFLPQVEPYIPQDAGEKISSYLQSGGWITEFQKTREFEEQIASYVGASHAVAVTSGTAALYLALKSLDIGPGDKVVVPNYTMIATINAVVWTGAEPVIADIDPQTFCLDESRLEIDTSCRALIYVSINGRPGLISKVKRFCDRKNIFLVEDAAQSLGAKHGEQYLGTIGKVGIYSFSPHKIITTGQGGMVVTNDRDIAESVRKLKDFCRVGSAQDWHEKLGYNFKFTDLQAVLGSSQAIELDWRIEKKKSIYLQYRNNLHHTNGIEFVETDLGETPPWFVDALLPSMKARDRLVSDLRDNNIGARPFYPPISQQPIYSEISGSFPVSEKLAPRGIWLPSSLTLSSAQIDGICDIVKSIVKS